MFIKLEFGYSAVLAQMTSSHFIHFI